MNNNLNESFWKENFNLQDHSKFRHETNFWFLTIFEKENIPHFPTRYMMQNHFRKKKTPNLRSTKKFHALKRDPVDPFLQSYKVNLRFKLPTIFREKRKIIGASAIICNNQQLYNNNARCLSVPHSAKKRKKNKK